MSTSEGSKETHERYLTFRLGQEQYGIEVLCIREIIRMQKITPVPHMPEHIRGVINLRGKVIPVLDMRLRFALGSDAIDERTCTIVVQHELPHGESALMGLIVDAVEEVIAIPVADIEEAPDFGAKVDTSLLRGLARVKGEVKLLLRVGLLFEDELERASR